MGGDEDITFDDDRDNCIVSIEYPVWRDIYYASKLHARSVEKEL